MKRAARPSPRAIVSATSTSNPRTREASAGSASTNGAPPSASPPHRSVACGPPCAPSHAASTRPGTTHPSVSTSALPVVLERLREEPNLERLGAEHVGQAHLVPDSLDPALHQLELLRVAQPHRVQPGRLRLAHVARRRLGVGIGRLVMVAQRLPVLVPGTLHRGPYIIAREGHGSSGRHTSHVARRTSHDFQCEVWRVTCDMRRVTYHLTISAGMSCSFASRLNAGTSLSTTAFRRSR